MKIRNIFIYVGIIDERVIRGYDKIGKSEQVLKG